MAQAPDRAESLPGTTVAGLLERMSAAPAPAAGSAAAVTAGMAAALVGKAARRSRRHLDDADALARTADGLRERALVLAGDDVAAVTAMVSSDAGLPPEAVAVPREIGGLAEEVAGLAERLCELGNPNLHADAVSARHLADAARAATDAILRSNLGPSDESGA